MTNVVLFKNAHLLDPLRPELLEHHDILVEDGVGSRDQAEADHGIVVGPVLAMHAGPGDALAEHAVAAGRVLALDAGDGLGRRAAFERI